MDLMGINAEGYDRDDRDVAVLLTGGTIICTYDDASGLITPSLHLDDLISMLPPSVKRQKIYTEEVMNIQGTSLTLDNGLDIARRVYEMLLKPSIKGVVVLQGTDTLDEISYLANLLIGAQRLPYCNEDWMLKPVVFTAAMKSIGEMYSDAIGNIAGAISVAASDNARGKGVLVYMNQRILSAADVEKMHSNRMDSFSSAIGPVGSIENGIVRFWRAPVHERAFPELLKSPSSAGLLPQDIYILKSYAGMDDVLFRTCIDLPAKGIVVEGLGAGNVQPSVVSALADAVAKGIPVVMTSRCREGAAFATYDYDGGGADLMRKGVIFSNGLSSQKARIKLSVLIAAGVRQDNLQSYFL